MVPNAPLAPDLGMEQHQPILGTLRGKGDQIKIEIRDGPVLQGIVAYMIICVNPSDRRI